MSDSISNGSESDFPKNGVEEFLRSRLTENQYKIIDYLQQLGLDDGVRIYKTICYLLYNKEIPCRQMPIAHLVRELFNYLVRIDRSVLLDDTVAILAEAKERVVSLKHIRIDKVKRLLNKSLGDLFDESEKIKALLTDSRPSLKEEHVVLATNKVKEAKGKLETLRHFRPNVKEFDEETLTKCIEDIGYFILLLIPNFSDKKEQLDNILVTLNSGNVVELGCHFDNLLQGDLGNYFFVKLKNPDCFEFLNKKRLLAPKKRESLHGSTYWDFPAKPYLQHIAPSKPQEVANTILPLLKASNNEMLICIFEDILAVVLKLKESSIPHFLRIFKRIVSILSCKCSFLSFYNLVIFKTFIKQSLSVLDKSAIGGLCSNLLKLKVAVSIDQYFGHDKFEFISVFVDDESRRESFKDAAKFVRSQLLDLVPIDAFNIMFDTVDDAAASVASVAVVII